MKTFNHQGNYKCICGKHFTNSQSFNGHKSHCKEYLGEEHWTKNNKNRKESSIQATKDNPRKSIRIECMCEYCGNIFFKKIRTSKTRFCSHKCANSFLAGKRKKPKIVIKPLPKIIKEKRQKGFFSRRKLSYPEIFWKTVLDNNKIEYEHDYIIQTGKGFVYRLDFKIGDVDLEIDSSLHDTEYCIEKDHRRDIFIKSLGYQVYRIRWVNPTTRQNKLTVNEQIDNLFEFIGVNRIQ